MNPHSPDTLNGHGNDDGYGHGPSYGYSDFRGFSAFLYGQEPDIPTAMLATTTG